MPNTQTRLAGVGDADAIAAYRPFDADAFARREPSRPTPMRADAVLVSGTGPDMPVTSPRLVAWPTGSPGVAAITRQRKTPARATSVTLPGPLFRLLASTGLLRWFVNRQRLVHSFAANLRGPAQPLTLAGPPLRAVIPRPGHHRQCPRHRRRRGRRGDAAGRAAGSGSGGGRAGAAARRGSW
jgi:hypothetical protein